MSGRESAPEHRGQPGSYGEYPAIQRAEHPPSRGKGRRGGGAGTRYVSARVWVLMPLAAVLIAFATVGTYWVTGAVAEGVKEAQTQQLLEACHGAVMRLGDFEAEHLAVLRLIAFTNGIPQAVRSRGIDSLQRLIEPIAANEGVDSVIVTDSDGIEILGLQRTDQEGGVDFAISTGTDLSTLLPVAAFIGDDPDLDVRPAGLVRTTRGYALYTAAPVVWEGEMLGVIMVGSRLSQLLWELRSGALTELALYGPDGRLLATTLPEPEEGFSALEVDEQTFEGALSATDSVPIRAFTLGGVPYQVAYMPFVVRGETLGVLATFVPNNIFFATETSRRVISLTFAAGVAALMVAGFVAITAVFTRRLERIRETAEALGAGDLGRRTGMQPIDEVGALGHAIDRMADQWEMRAHLMRLSLYAQRSEVARLSAVLRSIPDGLVLLDMDGRVVLINDAARELLGSRRVVRHSDLNRLTAQVTDALGPAMAPGIYLTGDETRVVVDERVLSAQAAAVMVEESGRPRERIGTVIVLRDVTRQAMDEQAREQLLARMARELQAPLTELHEQGMELVRAANGQSSALRAFVEGVHRNAIELARLILEFRDLASLDADSLRIGRRPISTENLMWDLVRDWKEAAEQAGLSIQVQILDRDMYVLGDERRLRWAIGNLIDNSVKYSLPGGEIMLRLERSKRNSASFMVSDTGVGISTEDLPLVWRRFFRGVPRTPDGKVLDVPGTGQGLYIARKVIEAHGGSIRLESRAGYGTTVYFTLPLTAPPVGEVGEPEIDTGRYAVEELQKLEARFAR